MNANKIIVKKSVLGYDAPQNASDSKYYDQNCPFTGGLSVKNELLVGVVIKKDTHRSATIGWDRLMYVPKYERYEKRRSRLRVHNPACIDAKIGKKVVVARTRPLSKTKNHVIISIVDPAVDVSIAQPFLAGEEKQAAAKKGRKVNNKQEFVGSVEDAHVAEDEE